MTTNNSLVNGGQLKPEYYDDYATHLRDEENADNQPSYYASYAYLLDTTYRKHSLYTLALAWMELFVTKAGQILLYCQQKLTAFQKARTAIYNCVHSATKNDTKGAEKTNE